MTRNERRNLIQLQAVVKSEQHQFLCLEWATGCGKTKAAADIIENILLKNPNATGYLVCKENTHKKNWKDDFMKHEKSDLMNNTKTVLYASLHKESKKADFVILDECHALTQKRVNALKKILQKDVQIIFLSATIPKEKKKLMISMCKKINFFTIDLNKAFELELLPKPKLVIHKVKLKKGIDGKIWDYPYRKAKGKVTKYCSHQDLHSVLNSVPKSVGIVCQGSEQEYYHAVSKQMAYYEKLSEDPKIKYDVRVGCRNKYLNLATVRKRFIAEVKTERVRALVNAFRLLDYRFICFTGSVKQADTIGAASAVHSKNTKEVNQDLIDCFNRNECTELFAVKMLRESVNLFNIEKGVITQLDSGIGSFFRMLGRTLRHEFPEMHLFVLQDTQDVKYFNKSMKNFNKDFLKYKEYD